MIDFDPQWYAVRVMIQREHAVAGMLREQGYGTLVPTEVRTHKRSSYSKGKAEFGVAMIPGCIFVGFPSEPAWYDVLRNHLIVAPISLTSDGMPTRIHIQTLMAFFAGVSDGCMVKDDGLRLIHIPGRTPVRALDTRVRTISAKRRQEKEKRPMQAGGKVPVVAPPRQYADFLARHVYGGTEKQSSCTVRQIAPISDSGRSS